MGEYKTHFFFGVLWNVLVVNNLGDGLAAIKRGEKAVHFDSSSQIGPIGAEEIALVLRENTSMLVLSIEYNRIGEGGAKSISEAVKVNTSLHTLCLPGNSIGDKGAESIAHALKVNKTLHRLDLGCNSISEKGAKFIGNAFKMNSTLRRLSLFGNYIRDQAVTNRMIACLKENRNHLDESAAFEEGDLHEWNCAKLMIVGPEAAGKTQTVRSLLGLPFQHEHFPTKHGEVSFARMTAQGWERQGNVNNGVGEKLADATGGKIAGNGLFTKPLVSNLNSNANSRLPMEEATRHDNVDNERDDTTQTKHMMFSLWDFGCDQDIFRTRFLTDDGLYLVVFDLVEILSHSDGSISCLRFWLDTIRLQAPVVPIILVGTCADKVCSKVELEEVNEILCRSLNIATFGVVKNEQSRLFFFPVNNNSHKKDRFSELRKIVEEINSQQDCYRRLVPLPWLMVLDEMTVPAFLFDEVCKISFPVQDDRRHS